LTVDVGGSSLLHGLPHRSEVSFDRIRNDFTQVVKK
jgi:hypothetical protein